jgi:hypothetical protein
MIVAIGMTIVGTPSVAQADDHAGVKVIPRDALVGAPSVAQAGDHARLKVISRDANGYGNAYGEWSARRWQWVTSIPAATNPVLLDDTSPGGARCGEGQSGPVWFLASSIFGGTFSRTCTVPSGKALFFPIVQAVFGAGVFDCEPTVPGVICNLASLRMVAAASMDDVTLSASLNGKPLRDLDDQRVQAPVFTLTYPEAGVIPGVPAGTYAPQVADGYWLMLAPPPAGAHTIHFEGMINSGPFAGFQVEVTYHLTVGP